MFQHVKYALRNLLQHPGYLSLNLLGFGLGIACAFLAALFAWQEHQVDQHFAGGERIYRIGCGFMNMGGFANGPEALVPQLLADCPAVECGTRLKKYSTEKIQIGQQAFEAEDVLYVDSVFFQLFDYPFVEGSRAGALRSADEVILSEALARKYFGDAPALGQTLRAGETGKTYRVSGVVGAPKYPSHLDGTLWLPIYSKFQNKAQPEWYAASFYSYVRLRPGAEKRALEQSLNRITRERIYPMYGNGAPYDTWAAGQNGYQWFVQPFRDIYLQSRLNFEAGGGGDPDKILGFLLIGFFILLIAIMNYVNLITARATVRAKAIGIRKTLGIGRFGLIRDLLLESALFGLGAAAVGWMAARGLMYAFHAITGADLLDLQRYGLLLDAGIGLFAVPVSLLAGLYPAIFMARFQPSAVLKGEWSPAGNKRLRGALVVGQFGIALVLLIAALGVFRQLRFMQERDWGFRRDGICVIENTNLLGDKAAAFRQEIARQSGVEATCLVGSLPAGSTMYFKTYQTPVMPQPLSLKSFLVDADFVPTLELQLTEGRNFNADMPTDTAAVIVNESAVKALGLGDHPLGAEVNKGARVIGVMRDFNYETLRNAIGPLVLQYAPKQHYYALARVQPAAQPAFLHATEATWNALAPGKPFSYYFLDASLAELSEKETVMGQAILLFTGLAFFIACLGLFGLATFLTSRRAREIGIRKVLGASVAGIVRELSGDFLKPVGLAFLLAAPLAIYGLQRWLQGFAYRTDIAWWLPALAGGLALALAFGTVSLQSLRAALANPAESLRSE